MPNRGSAVAAGVAALYVELDRPADSALWAQVEVRRPERARARQQGMGRGRRRWHNEISLNVVTQRSHSPRCFALCIAVAIDTGQQPAYRYEDASSLSRRVGPARGAEVLRAWWRRARRYELARASRPLAGEARCTRLGGGEGDPRRPRSRFVPADGLGGGQGGREATRDLLNRRCLHLVLLGEQSIEEPGPGDQDVAELER